MPTLRFRLLGIAIEIQLFFWITTVVLGLSGLDRASPKGALPAWVAIVFVSVLVHEAGHALAVMRHGIAPSITLHAMGGTTSWSSPGQPLRRRDLVIISAAGPVAGFLFGGLILLAVRLIPHAPLPPLAVEALRDVSWINFGWGLVNLVPVLPFDGGRVLESALGPPRARLAAIISLGAALAVAAFFMWIKVTWGALLFGLSAMQSWQLLQQAAAAPPDLAAEVPPELSVLLDRARRALVDERLDAAAELAQRVIEGDGSAVEAPPRAVFEALEVIAWTHLLAGRPDAALEALTEASRRMRPDAALEGAVLLANDRPDAARIALESARGRGDRRRDVLAGLIQALIALGDAAEAARLALEEIDGLSDEDARKMAEIADGAGAFAGAAALWEALFARAASPEDAYAAARAEAQGGHLDAALALLRRAVEAGFRDGARAWSDAALEPLRATGQLEALWPRP